VKSKTQAQSKNLVPTNLMLDDEIRKKNQFIKLTKVKINSNKKNKDQFDRKQKLKEDEIIKIAI
jgi:hypothetical protein